MQIEVTYQEQGIVLNHYQGVVSIDHMLDVTARNKALVRGQGLTRFVTIIDASALQSISADAKTLGPTSSRLDPPLCVGYLVINAPLMVRALGDFVRRLFGYQVTFHRTLDEALVQARHLLDTLPPE